MKGYTFDPGRLRGSVKQRERECYAVAARMLREYLGGDPLAEFRRRARRDQKLRGMFAATAAELAIAAAQMGTSGREGC